LLPLELEQLELRVLASEVLHLLHLYGFERMLVLAPMRYELALRIPLAASGRIDLADRHLYDVDFESVTGIIDRGMLLEEDWE